MSKYHGWHHVLWAAPLTVVLGAPALAQEPATEAGAIDEVVVTARRREQNLIEVPLAITAVSAQQIEREGIKDVEGIVSRDTSLDFDLGFAPYDTRIVIRGLSPTRGRPNVATLIDGIDVSSEAIGVAGGSLLINPRLVDIKQVEVVKGPQSALFGRSAFAGAISYTTADPTDEISGSMAVDVSNRSQTDIKAGLSVPVTDTLGARLNGYVFSDDGFYRNTTTGSRVGGGDGKGASLTVKWQPSEAYSLKFRTEYTDDSFDPPPQALLPFNAVNQVPASASVCNVGLGANGMGVSVGIIRDATCPATAAVEALGLHAFRELERLTGNLGVFNDMLIPAFRGSAGDAQNQGLNPSFSRNYARSADNGATAPDFPGSNRQVLRLSAVQNFALGFGSISSLTGYTRALVSTDFDPDKNNSLAVQQTLTTDGITEQFSQELRFTSEFQGRVQLVGGAQYWTERADQFDSNISVFGQGTTCFALDPFGPPGTAIQAPPFTVIGPILTPAGSCTNPTGGFTSADISSFMDNVAAARVPSFVRRTVDHRSFYLDVEWQVLDSLKFIAEARYVDEENTVTVPQTDGQNGPGTVTLCGSNGPCRVGNIPSAGIPFAFTPMGFAAAPVRAYPQSPPRSDRYTTPKGTLQWTPNENTNVYLSYSKAQKPGGYSTITIGGTGIPLVGGLPSFDDILFQPEKMTVYELGAKWRSSDRRLQLNGAIFKQDFTDKQVGSQVLIGNTISNRVTNAGAAVLEGLELAAQWQPTANWNFSGGLTYFGKYEYTDYKITSVSAGEIARVGNCTIGYLDSAGFVALGSNAVPFIPGTTTLRSLTCQIDRSGHKLEDTSKIAAALGVGYRRQIGDGASSVFVDFDANWQDKRFIEDDNSQWVDAYWLANLRVGLETRNWSAIFYIDNLSDDRTIKSAGTGPSLAQSSFRTGAMIIQPAPGVNVPAGLTFAPKFVNNAFADLPRPQTIGLRISYKF